MTYTCPICKTISRNESGPEIWPREVGFIEIDRPNKNGCSDCWSVCSFDCAIKLVTALSDDEFIVSNRKKSKQFKCESCNGPVPQFIYQDAKAEQETIPNSCPKLVIGDTYIVFCCDACLLDYLKANTATLEKANQ